MKHWHFETQSVHAGRSIDPATRAVVPPLHLSTTFERDQDGSYPQGFHYATFDNPNRAWLEQAVCDLEDGARAIASSSGMAAIAGVLSTLDPGDRVIISYDLFQGTARLINEQLARMGIEVDIIDTTNLDQVKRTLKPKTRMIWLDTPSNPLLRVSDISAISELAKPQGVRVAVDSTFATFALQKPLQLGADVAVHAATKYISGHSDVVNGLAVFAAADVFYERARSFQINVGTVPAPFDCWLVHRGLRTLPLRVHAQSASALRIAHFLESHSRVAQVYYPGLPSDPGHSIAKRQMTGGFGGMISFASKGGPSAAKSIVARTKLFSRAASLGGVESLIEHRASSPIQTSGIGTGFRLPNDIIRLSIGVEHVDDLITDLQSALN